MLAIVCDAESLGLFSVFEVYQLLQFFVDCIFLSGWASECNNRNAREADDWPRQPGETFAEPEIEQGKQCGTEAECKAKGRVWMLNRDRAQDRSRSPTRMLGCSVMVFPSVAVRCASRGGD
ncbi:MULTISPECIES: hypothetical protein [unclassified Corynebacterium]|uniref:hypothetical protein n=1 Tax=unclassified Corynebacterium TaxID=2624378 RepID=UPI001177AC8D|nr:MULTISPECIES: hypothetical protein [unclassified Corynebacterium]TVX80406.1 hypothetical protein FPP74_04870 [Corynebacterium sp. NML180780]